MDIRLDKFLAEAGVGTRSQVRACLKKGEIRLNGMIVKKADIKIDPLLDRVEYLGKTLSYMKNHYYMLNKPAGILSATRDKNEKTVMELLKGEPGRDMFPVGRLDRDTEGLLIITDDGALAHELLSPKKHVDKTYYIIAQGRLLQEDIEALCDGVDIGDEKKTRPAKASLLEYKEAADESVVLLTIHEGRFHQVKRMMEAVGKPVKYLKRLSMGNLKLDESLLPGQYRPLSKEEIEALRP